MASISRYLLLLLICTSTFIFAQDQTGQGEGSTEEVDPSKEWYDDDGIAVLNKDNFDYFLEKTNHALIEFYTPWCGHCKKFAPEFKKLVELLELDEVPVKLAKVDATDEQDIAKKYGVTVFPTLKFFSNGHITDYVGDRDLKDIVKFCQKKTGSLIKKMFITSEITAQLALREVTAYFFGDEEHESYKLFSNALQGLEEVQGILVTVSLQKHLRNTLGVPENSEDLIVVSKPFDEATVPYKGEFEVNKLRAFFKNQTTPVIFEYNEDLKKVDRARIDHRKPLYILFVADNEDGNDAKQAFRDLALELRGEAYFAWIDDIEKEKEMADFYQITEDMLPTARISQIPAVGQIAQKFKPRSNFYPNYNDLYNFLKDWLAGYNRFQYRSGQPVPKEDKNKYIRDVVQSTFRKIVLDPTKDCLVEFYADWCDSCKHVGEEYEKAAERLSKVQKLTLARVEASLNEIDYNGLSINAYPTFYFYPAWRKEEAPIQMKFKSYTADKIVEWTKKHLSKPYNGEL